MGYSGSFDYNSFTDQTKKYLKLAMDVYSDLSNRKITKIVKEPILHEEETVTYNKRDKIILSLFIAAFMEGSSIDNIVNDCEQLSLDDFYKFLEIPGIEPNSMSEEEYENLYNESFKMTLYEIIDLLSGYYNIKNLSPAVIFYSVHNRYDTNSDVIDHIFLEYDKSNRTSLMDEPIFRSIEYFAKEKGDFKHKEIKQGKSSGHSGMSIMDLWSNPAPSLVPKKEDVKEEDDKGEVETVKEETDAKEASNPKKKDNDIVIDSKTWEYIEELRRKYIGQEEFSEDIFYNIVNNIMLSKQDKIPSGERSIIFVDGPSGTGKTAITTDIAKTLGVPCVCTSITNFSSTGYVGKDLTDILKQLVEKAKGNMDLAKRGIVIIDEFDKIASDKNSDLSMKKAVQDQLLGFLGGETYTVTLASMPIFGSIEGEFDTSNLTFVLLGALTNLRDEKMSNKQPIGFSTGVVEENNEYSINPSDLINMGLQKELVGRINTYLHTRDYGIEDLEKILRESSISPIIGFTKWAEHFGKKVEIDDEVYPLIAEKAYDFNTGARSLQTIMDSIRTRYLKQVLRGSEDIHLNEDDVRAAYAKTIGRSKRA